MHLQLHLLFCTEGEKTFSKTKQKQFNSVIILTTSAHTTEVFELNAFRKLQNRAQKKSTKQDTIVQVSSNPFLI